MFSDFVVNTYSEKTILQNGLYVQKSGLNAELVKRASYDYRRNKLVLVLGAGVSASSGLPDWVKLIKDCLVKILTSKSTIKSEVKDLTNLFFTLFGSNNLITANYLSNELRKVESTFLFKMVQEELYKNYEKKISPLFLEIINLTKDGSYYRMGDHSLNSIITYNYDNLIEMAFKEVAPQVDVAPVYNGHQKVNSKTLPIYHVHGYLPFEKTTNIDNEIVFSETSYHQQYFDHYSWNNLIQFDKFRNYNCVFIGSSFQDPNMRRILEKAAENATAEESLHYLVKRKLSVNDLRHQLNSFHGHTTDVSDKQLSELLDLITVFEEDDARKLKTEIIWINDYLEIPEILSDIYCFSLKNDPDEYLFFRSDEDPIDIFHVIHQDYFRQLISDSKNLQELRDKMAADKRNFRDVVWKQIARYYKLNE